MKAGLLAVMLALLPATAWALDGQVTALAQVANGIGQVDNSITALLVIAASGTGLPITAPLVPGLLGN